MHHLLGHDQDNALNQDYLLDFQEVLKEAAKFGMGLSLIFPMFWQKRGTDLSIDNVAMSAQSGQKRDTFRHSNNEVRYTFRHSEDGVFWNVHHRHKLRDVSTSKSIFHSIKLFII